MNRCFFVSDLHGDTDKYLKLFKAVRQHCPKALFLGGDLLPHGLGLLNSVARHYGDFINAFLAEELLKIRRELDRDYPEIFVILGNDDARIEEAAVLEVAGRGLWHYLHMRTVAFKGYQVYGYAHTPPSPLTLKDWERYDVSRFVDPGCISPLEGKLTVPVARRELQYGTIAQDLEILAGKNNMSEAVFLFHAPPYKTNLDRAGLDGRKIDLVPLDVHVGSIAVQRFIEKRQPLLTLHGHIHESARLTGSWHDKIGRTVCFTAAHDGPELALVQFDLDNPEEAVRELL
ncbi:MAG: metallophosphoesterase [candidate division Zixibacteria bacterium]|nr:metallophosphoesterase [candidate division Zixibacteria bacterium]